MNDNAALDANIALVQEQIRLITPKDVPPVKGNENVFQWDYPTQGYVFPRTLEQAFGPGTEVPQAQPFVTATGLCYTAASLIFLLTLWMLAA